MCNARSNSECRGLPEDFSYAIRGQKLSRLLARSSCARDQALTISNHIRHRLPYRVRLLLSVVVLPLNRTSDKASAFDRNVSRTGSSQDVIKSIRLGRRKFIRHPTDGHKLPSESRAQ